MIHVFLGPTLAPGAVHELLPSAVVRPPIKYGDLIRIAPEPGDVVAVVDGYFHQAPAVRHKEILAALDAGVSVFGAASMGALRAAELHPFGMVGVGEIYEMLVAGVIEGDDEVAVLHASAEDGYRPLGEALVDIRLHCRQARAAGALDAAGEATIVGAGQALPFDDRTYPAILAAARDQGLAPEDGRRYADFVAQHGESVKQRDALALLRRLQDPVERGERRRFELADTPWLHSYRLLRSGWRDAAGTFATDRMVLDLVRITARGYPRFHQRVALEELAALHAEHAGISVPDADALLDAFRARHVLEAEPALREWCEARHMRRPELVACLARRARLRALVPTLESDEERVPIAELERLVGDYAVALGLWERDSPPEAWLAAWLTREEAVRLSESERIARVAVRTFQTYPNASARGVFVPGLKLSGTYAVARRLLLERRPMPGARPQASDVLAWCAARWGVPRIVATDLLDRGLARVESCAAGLPVMRELVAQARPLYARVSESGDYPPLEVGGERC